MRAVRLRDASDAGLTRAVLRGPAWRKLSHGLYLLGDGESLSLRQQCKALLEVLPAGSVFIEFTAALLHEWWVPPLPASVPICVGVPPATQPRRRGLRARRLALGSDDVTTVSGVPVTAPNRTLSDLAESLALVDLVVLADSALHLESCDLRQLTASPTPQRGAVRWRRALQLVDGRSESPWETLLRLVHVLSGIEDVEPQVELHDEQSQFVARGDLWLVGTRRVHEFDGGVHRGANQHRLDLARDRRFARAGVERYGYTARDVIATPGQIVRDAEIALGLEHDPTRVRPWLAEIRQSLFTPSGQEQFRRRWHLGDGSTT